MFSNDEYRNKIASNNIQKTKQDAKYSCNICFIQESSKDNLAQHKSSVHENLGNPHRNFNQHSTSKRKITEKRRAMEEREKYICGHCN